MIIVSDTGPVSNLIQIGQLHLLRDLFGSIVIPQAVADELMRGPVIAEAIHTAHDWIEIRPVSDSKTFQELRAVLDAGESEAIALAKELGADLLLMDERKGHRIAAKAGLKTTGTIGILLKAKDAGLIPTVKEHLRALKDNYDFWVSESLIASVLRTTNEV